MSVQGVGVIADIVSARPATVRREVGVAGVRREMAEAHWLKSALTQPRQ